MTSEVAQDLGTVSLFSRPRAIGTANTTTAQLSFQSRRGAQSRDRSRRPAGNRAAGRAATPASATGNPSVRHQSIREEQGRAMEHGKVKQVMEQRRASEHDERVQSGTTRTWSSHARTGMVGQEHHQQVEDGDGGYFRQIEERCHRQNRRRPGPTMRFRDRRSGSIMAQTARMPPGLRTTRPTRTSIQRRSTGR